MRKRKYISDDRVNQRLLAARGNRTQAEMAALLGLPCSTYCKLENGNVPRAEIGMRIADFLGIAFDDLWGAAIRAKLEKAG